MENEDLTRLPSDQTLSKDKTENPKQFSEFRVVCPITGAGEVSNKQGFTFDGGGRRDQSASTLELR